ncbi:MAG: hypothetical protein ABSH49_17225 [Bryobacteraceae bacterium]
MVTGEWRLNNRIRRGPQGAEGGLGSQLKKQNCGMGKHRFFCWLEALSADWRRGALMQFCAFLGEIRAFAMRRRASTSLDTDPGLGCTRTNRSAASGQELRGHRSLTFFFS